ncbi:glycosyltransferase [Lysinibacillus sp. NPDC092081]|uniref:glycosyltransferase n=1 Tax=Lysinibacillus sp. NPDC092081 TaxID=3364131 RepID=UPI0037FAB161
MEESNISTVSIILPVYNSELFVQQAIESVLKQTYTQIELIIIDDGSTDNTKRILCEYESNPKVHIISLEKNSGVSVARNIGIQEAKGEYIAFIDADDLFMPNKVEEQVNVFKQNPSIDFVFNDIMVIDHNNNKVNELQSYFQPKNILLELCFRQIIPAPACIMVKRDFINRFNIMFNKDFKYAEDYDFTFQLFLQGKHFYLKESLYLWRRHINNTSNNIISTRKIENSIVIKYLKYIDVKKDEDLSTYGKILYKIEKYDESRNVFLEVIKKSLNQDMAYFYLGNIEFYKQQYRQALQYYTSVDKKSKFAAETLNNSACIYIILHQHDEAVKKLNIALSKRSNYIDAQFNLFNLDAKNLKFTNRELRPELLNYVSEEDIK